MYRLVLAAVLASLWLGWPAAASADDAPLDANRFHPALGSERIMTTDLAAVGPNWELVPQLFFHFADAPMTLTLGGEPAGEAVRNRFTSDLGIALSLRDRIQLGVSFPITLAQSSDEFDLMPVFDDGESINPPSEISSLGLEDLRLSAKGVIGHRGPWGLGVSGSLTAPTGDGDSYLGTRLPTFDLRLIGHYRNGRLSAGANVGWLFASTERVLDTRSGMALTFGGGVQYDVYRNQTGDTTVALAAELFGFAHSRFEGSAEAPVEALFAGKANHKKWTFFLGAGPGVTRGYGEPNVRVLAGASFRWQRSLPPPPPEPPPPLEPAPAPVVPVPETTPTRNRWVDSTLTLPSGVLFAFDSCQIKPESFEELRKVALALGANPDWGNIRIEGHASQEADRDSGKTEKELARYNIRLSRCRADRVAKFLVFNGVPEERLTYFGFGYTCPRAPNDTEENRQKNRRVEFVRNPEINPPRCNVPEQSEPLYKHSSEPYLYKNGQQPVTPPTPGTAPGQPAAPPATPDGAAPAQPGTPPSPGASSTPAQPGASQPAAQPATPGTSSTNGTNGSKEQN